MEKNLLFYHILVYNRKNEGMLMNDELELAEVSLENANSWIDIWNNPVVQALLISLKICPPLATGIECIYTQILDNNQKKKQEELCQIIFSDRSITLEDVKNVDFIMGFARAWQVNNWLLANEKVKYIANLFKRTFTGIINENTISEYEEYLHRLDYMSFREIDMLFLLYQCEREFSVGSQKNLTKYDEAWDKFKKETVKKYDLDENMIVSIMSGLTMTGFCQEAHFMRPGSGIVKNPYYTTEYFERFLKLIK